MEWRRAVGRFDESVDVALDRWRGTPHVDRLMYTITDLADFSLLWHIIGVGQALRPGRDPKSALRAAVILGVESTIVNGPVKNFTRRTRPVSKIPHPHRLRTPRTTSFPSGHASAAFTFAGVMAEDDPLWPLYYALAVTVSVSRPYVAIHFASDVVVGAAFGFALSRVARRAWPVSWLDHAPR